MEQELIHYNGRIKVPYKWAAGETASRFFTELRDHKRLLGKKCDPCNITHFPPKKVCQRCFNETQEWAEVEPTGKLISFTTVHYHDKNVHILEPPFSFGLVKLDKADTAFIHLLGECRAADLKIGLRVEAVFEYDRKGTILDINYFRPIKE
ncbi:Zn-ribbon domain-containing OB-fold protein [Thermodesulfobacteriota bacterium]